MSSQSYTARHLSVLEGLEAVRKRPGMYIGSTDSRGLMHCLYEIIDNSVDEALEGYCDRIDVTLHPDHSVSVHDNGRGIPVDEVPGTSLSGIEVVFTKLHAGGKFGNGSYTASGGLHGVGASVVNALSARLDVAVDRGGKTYEMAFRRGEPGVFDDSDKHTPGSPFTAFTDHSQLRVTGRVPRKQTGTRVRFWADFEIFPMTSSRGFVLSELLDRARQTSFLVPGLTVNVIDERGAETVSESFRHDGGTVDFVDYLAEDNPVTATWHIVGEDTYTETVQQLDKNSKHLIARDVERQIKVDIALRWGQGYDTIKKSFVNIVETPMGGTHLTGFEQGLVKALRNQIDKNRKSKRLKISAKDPRIEKDDILAGLSAVVTVKLPEPQFEGQTKEVLGTPQARSAVSKIVSAWITERMSSGKRDLKNEAFLLMDKVIGEMHARVSAHKQKEISRRKTALESASMPAKLADCRSKEVDNTELFIVEGDSALGTAKQARSADFQALLPIRGKILNVQKASVSDMLANAECSAIIQVIGAGSGRSFDLDQIRYGKVIMMTDADVDGAHIRTLLLTLFFRYMRPMIEAGRVYAAVPPLHRVEVVAKGKRKGEVIYTYSDEQLHQVLADLKKRGRSYREPIQRYKGLGEMDADQLSETTMNPEHRTLRRITLADEAEIRQAEEVFELLMGTNVPPRRDFIVVGADNLSVDQIDA